MNGLLINPAYAGSQDVLSLSAMYRYQWVGFEGAPVTSTLSGHTPLANKNMGLGFSCINEKMGITNNTSFYGNYAYRIGSKLHRLSLGIKAGFDLLKDDETKITTQQADYVFNNTQSAFLPNFGLGIYYFSKSESESPDYFAGFSIPKILSYRTDNNGAGYKAYNSVQNYDFLLTGGLLLKASDNLKIKPSTLIHYHGGSPFLFDVNCNLIMFDDNLWLGMAYRSKDALVGLLEFKLNTQIRFGYSYDYTLGPLTKYNSGSHEIMLRYEFKYNISATNPRYF